MQRGAGAACRLTTGLPWSQQLIASAATAASHHATRQRAAAASSPARLASTLRIDADTGPQTSIDQNMRRDAEKRRQTEEAVRQMNAAAETLLRSRIANTADAKEWRFIVDTIEDALDKGLRPTPLMFYTAIAALCKLGCTAHVRRIYALMQTFGYDLRVGGLNWMLMAAAKAGDAAWVHNVVADILSLREPCGDETYMRLVFAFFAIEAPERAYKVLDMYRSTGGPTASILQFAVSEIMKLPATQQQYARNSALLRSLISYTALTPGMSSDEVVVVLRALMMTFTDRDLLLEALVQRRIVELAPPALLEEALLMLARNEETHAVAKRGGLHLKHSRLTLEEFASGTVPSAEDLAQRMHAPFSMLEEEGGGGGEGGCAAEEGTSSVLRSRADGEAAVRAAGAAALLFPSSVAAVSGRATQGSRVESRARDAARAAHAHARAAVAAVHHPFAEGDEAAAGELSDGGSRADFEQPAAVEVADPAQTYVATASLSHITADSVFSALLRTSPQLAAASAVEEQRSLSRTVSSSSSSSSFEPSSAASAAGRSSGAAGYSRCPTWHGDVALARIPRDATTLHRSLCSQSPGPLLGGLDLGSAFAGWKSSAVLAVEEANDRRLRFAAGILLQLEALGHPVLDVTYRSLFAALALHGKALAAVQVASRMLPRDLRLSDTLGVDSVLMAWASTGVPALQLRGLYRQLLAPLLVPELLLSYVYFCRVYRHALAPVVMPAGTEHHLIDTAPALDQQPALLRVFVVKAEAVKKVQFEPVRFLFPRAQQFSGVSVGELRRMNLTSTFRDAEHCAVPIVGDVLFGTFSRSMSKPIQNLLGALEQQGVGRCAVVVEKTRAGDYRAPYAVFFPGEEPDNGLPTGRLGAAAPAGEEG